MDKKKNTKIVIAKTLDLYIYIYIYIDKSI